MVKRQKVYLEKRFQSSWKMQFVYLLIGTLIAASELTYKVILMSVSRKHIDSVCTLLFNLPCKFNT
jgi:hypothetical protein